MVGLPWRRGPGVCVFSLRGSARSAPTGNPHSGNSRRRRTERGCRRFSSAWLIDSATNQRPRFPPPFLSLSSSAASFSLSPLLPPPPLPHPPLTPSLSLIPSLSLFPSSRDFVHHHYIHTITTYHHVAPLYPSTYAISTPISPSSTRHIPSCVLFLSRCWRYQHRLHLHIRASYNISYISTHPLWYILPPTYYSNILVQMCVHRGRM